MPHIRRNTSTRTYSLDIKTNRWCATSQMTKRALTVMHARTQTISHPDSIEDRERRGTHSEQVSSSLSISSPDQPLNLASSSFSISFIQSPA